MNGFQLRPGARILFQGDSITDAGRLYEDGDNLGLGYPNFAAAWLSALYPERNLTFINRGISGNRIYDLEERWTEDCIALKPDWVSIFIGINDTWRLFDSGVPSPAAQFEACYRRLLDRVRSETGAAIILMDPFVLPWPADRLAWREDLDPRIEVVQRLAAEYGALHVPLDRIFAEAATRRPAAFWAEDGVHPTQPGHALIAQNWIAAVQAK